MDLATTQAGNAEVFPAVFVSPEKELFSWDGGGGGEREMTAGNMSAFIG